MKQYENVKDYPGLVRDLETNAILNVDYSKVQQAILLKEKRKKDKEERLNFERRISNIENDMAEIKTALQTLIRNL
jgi:hypothetical protein